MHLYPCKQVINNKEKNEMTLIMGESDGFNAFWFDFENTTFQIFKVSHAVARSNCMLFGILVNITSDVSKLF